MLEYKIENGFSVNLKFDTKKHKDKEFEGYVSKIIINGKNINKIYHTKLSDRNIYSQGIFDILKLLTKN